MLAIKFSATFKGEKILLNVVGGNNFISRVSHFSKSVK